MNQRRPFRVSFGNRRDHPGEVKFHARDSNQSPEHLDRKAKLFLQDELLFVFELLLADRSDTMVR